MIKRQVLEFALKNWKAILIVLLSLVVTMKTRHDYSLMQKAYETQSDSHKAQIDGLKEIHKQEIQEKQLLMESHLESIATIEEEYEDAMEQLEKLREKKNNEYTKKFRQDRQQLIKDIETKFGIESCDTQTEYQLKIQKEEHNFKLDNLKIEHKALTDEYDLFIIQKDKEINILADSLKKTSPGYKWLYFAGGILIGTAGSYGAYKAIND